MLANEKSRRAALSMLRPSTFAVLVAALPFNAYANATDQEVLRVVLDHFAARTDAHFYDAQSTLALLPTTKKLRLRETDYAYINQGEGHCSIERPLFLAILKRNSASVPSEQIVPSSLKWRIVAADTVSPGMVGLLDKPREPMKTLLEISRPGYLKDGKTALVFMSFTWSMHGADAQYVLRRTAGGWGISCSHLVFYV